MPFRRDYHKKSTSDSREKKDVFTASQATLQGIVIREEARRATKIYIEYLGD